MTIRKPELAERSKTTLSSRGADLASGDNIREMFKTILANPYDPDTNPEGFINIGTSENVMTPTTG